MRHKLLQLLSAIFFIMLMIGAGPQQVLASFQAQEAEKAAERGRGQAKKAGEEARRTRGEAEREGRQRGVEARDSAKAEVEKVREDAEEAVDETGEEVKREGRQAQDAAEREARHAEEGARGNMRMERGKARSPEALLAQIETAKANEMERHVTRMTRIEEIRLLAEAESNQNALERVSALVEKEKTLHEKKMAGFTQMETRFHERMSRKQGKDAAKKTTGAEAGTEQ